MAANNNEPEGEKTEVPGIYKVREGILINKDKEGLLAYKKQKERLKSIDTLQNDMKDLKSEMQEIKEILKGLVR